MTDFWFFCKHLSKTTRKKQKGILIFDFLKWNKLQILLSIPIRISFCSSFENKNSLLYCENYLWWVQWICPISSKSKLLPSTGITKLALLTKGPFINGVRKNFGFLTPSPLLFSSGSHRPNLPQKLRSHSSPPPDCFNLYTKAC